AGQCPERPTRRHDGDDRNPEHQPLLHLSTSKNRVRPPARASRREYRPEHVKGWHQGGVGMLVKCKKRRSDALPDMFVTPELGRGSSDPGIDAPPSGS